MFTSGPGVVDGGSIIVASKYRFIVDNQEAWSMECGGGVDSVMYVVDCRVITKLSSTCDCMQLRLLLLWRHLDVDHA